MTEKKNFDPTHDLSDEATERLRRRNREIDRENQKAPRDNRDEIPD